MVKIDCADGMTVTATRREWEEFVADKVKMYDQRILCQQTKQIWYWKKRANKRDLRS